MNYAEGETRFRAPSTAHENAAENAQIQQQLGHMVWEAGSKQIKESINTYGRIDVFRPYFDVNPTDVRTRLVQSFIPKPGPDSVISHDLYGPSMIVLTMVALLLLNMKSSGQDGTLIGTAMVSCFLAWTILSAIIFMLCVVLNIDIPFVNTCSLGYSMTSHCAVLFLTAIYHPSHDHVYFFALLFIFCLPAALKIGIHLSSKTREHTHKATVTAVCVTIHLLYLIYLHFGFHVVVEEIDEILGDPAPVIRAAVTTP